MLRVALRSATLILCFLVGVFVTQTTHGILFEREFTYTGVACGPNVYENLYKTSDGTKVGHEVINTRGRGPDKIDYIERIEERNRQGMVKILERWPKPLIRGRDRSKMLLAISTDVSNPTAVLVWTDDAGLNIVRSESIRALRDFAAFY